MGQYEEFLAGLKTGLQQEEKLLRCSDRADEADFARIKLNICDIALTVYGVFSKQGEGFEAGYAAKLDEMRRRWESSREAARQHGDIQTAVVEEIKIGMMMKIEEKFKALALQHKMQ